MDVSLDQIRALISAVEANSSQGGTGYKCLPHPALRMQVRQLEIGLQIRLLEPDSNCVQLTEAGSTVLTVFKQLLAQFDAAVLQAQDLEPGPAGARLFSKRQDSE